MSNTLTKRQKVALLLHTLGDAQAQQIIRCLEPTQAVALSREMGALAQVSNDEKRAVLREFRTLVARDGQRPAQGAAAVLATLLPSRAAELLVDEPPRVVALMLHTAAADVRKRILQQLPVEMQAAVTAELRTAKPSPELREQLEAALRAKAQRLAPPVEAAQPEMPAPALPEPAPAMPARAPEAPAPPAALEFAQLDRLPLPVLQSLLRQVEARVLVAALRGADQALVVHVLQAIPLSRRIVVQGMLNARQPVRLADIMAAQHDIVRLAGRALARLTASAPEERAHA